MKLLFYVSNCIALFALFSASLDQIISPFGFNSKNTSIIFAIIIVSGIVGAILGSYWVGAT